MEIFKLMLRFVEKVLYVILKIQTPYSFFTNSTSNTYLFSGSGENLRK